MNTRELFQTYQLIAHRESRWDKRHPLYARMLYWPLVGASLRRRRRAFAYRIWSPTTGESIRGMDFAAGRADAGFAARWPWLDVPGKQAD